MILVCGATGAVGGAAVEQLTAAGAPVRAFVRDPARRHFGARTEVAVGDLLRPETVAAALDGVSGVLLISSGPEALRQEENVTAAVRRAGVARVVKVSSVAAMPPVTNSYGAIHAAGEDALRRCGAAWTVLRAAAFASNTLHWLWSLRAEGRVYQPFGSIPQAVVDPADVAAVAVRALEGGHDGRTHVVTGPEALTGPQRAQRLAAAIGRPVAFVDAPVDVARKAMLGTGLPEDYVDGVLASQADPDPARGGTVLPTVREVTGRPPASFDDWLSRHRRLFTEA